MADDSRKTRLLPKMMGFYLSLLVLVGGAIVFALVKIIAVDGSEWRKRSVAREQSQRVDPARRGVIYSSDGHVLATTMPVCDLYLDLGRMPKKDKDGEFVRDAQGQLVMESMVEDSLFAAGLDEVCSLINEGCPGKSQQYYKNLILSERSKDKPSRCFLVQKGVPYSYWTRLCGVKGWSRCVVRKLGTESVTRYIRAHIYGNLAENTIGIHYGSGVGYDRYTGLEGYYDSVLRGQDGRYVCRRLTKGVWLPVDDGANASLLDSATIDSTLIKPRIDGQSIVSTLDTRYQDIADNALRDEINRWGGRRGCAILMEVETGYVLACSSLVRDTSGRCSEKLWSNVACSDIYEPGSTFKTVALMAMMNDKKISFDTAKRVRVGGQVVFSNGSGVIRDEHHPVDTVSIPYVLAASSNVGMCNLGWEFYQGRHEDLRKGMMEIFPHQNMQLDLSVNMGVGRFNELHSDRDFLNLCYGYSNNVSPIQVITFYNAIANNGRMMKPLFCREIIDGSHRKKVNPVVLNEQVCSKETAKQLQSMLACVVEHGTGRKLLNDVYGIAGKTGTSITSDSYGKTRQLMNASFVGFFPSDHPRYTCLVLVEGVGTTGAQVAIPVFQKISNCVVALDKELGSIRLQEQAQPQSLMSYKLFGISVPKTPTAAKGNWSQLKSVYDQLGLEYVLADSIPPETWYVYNGEKECYQNYEAPTARIPDCRGMTIKDALHLMRSLGLNVRFSGFGKVVSQQPAPGTPFKKGATASLTLGH